MSKKIIFTSVFILITAITAQTAVAVFNTSTAPSPSSTEDILVSENDLLSELGVSEPTLLPDSPFYFLKSIKRKIKEFFTFDPVKKNELRLKFAAEKLLEAKKMAEKNKNPQNVIKALNNYEKEIEKIKKALNIKEKTKKENPKITLFVDKLIKHELVHEKILKALQEKTPQDVADKIEKARQKHIAVFSQVMTELQDKESLKKEFRKNIAVLGRNEIKALQNLEALKEIQKYAPSTTSKEVANEAIEATLFRLKEKFAQLSEKDQKKIQSYLETRGSRDPVVFDVLQDLKSGFKDVPQVGNRLQEIQENVMQKIKKQQEKMGCKEMEWPSKDFCKKGRVIPEFDAKGCITGFRCIVPAEVSVKNTIKPQIWNPTITSFPNIPELPEEYRLCLKDLSAIDIKSEIERKIKVCLSNPTIEDDFWEEARVCLKNLCPKVLKEDIPESCKKLIDSQKICEKIDKIHRYWPEKPEIPVIYCPQLWDPVCGKDDRTYSNSCWAKAANVEIDHKGACERPETFNATSSERMEKSKQKFQKIQERTQKAQERAQKALDRVNSIHQVPLPTSTSLPITTPLGN